MSIFVTQHKGKKTSQNVAFIYIPFLNGQEYICIMDIAKSGRSNPSDILKNYLRNRSNIEFLGL